MRRQITWTPDRVQLFLKRLAGAGSGLLQLFLKTLARDASREKILRDHEK